MECVQDQTCQHDSHNILSTQMQMSTSDNGTHSQLMMVHEELFLGYKTPNDATNQFNQNDENNETKMNDKRKRKGKKHEGDQDNVDYVTSEPPTKGQKITTSSKKKRKKKKKKQREDCNEITINESQRKSQSLSLDDNHAGSDVDKDN